MDTEALTSYVQSRFRELADPDKAGPMSKYMKTEMPFYGIQKKDRAPVEREIARRFVPDSAGEYNASVLALWMLPHREEKYAAIDYAQRFDPFVVADSLPLFERLIREGAWWDLVDGVASNLVGRAFLKDRSAISPALEQWIDDPNMWIRRTALLAHLRHKSDTDEEQLFDFCLRRAFESEFFIRKAIGWALREYSKTAPQAVWSFVRSHESVLSGLTRREAMKHLHRTGYAGGG